MPIVKCPGQDTRFWKPEDIFEATCPYCGHKVEFWKDDPRRKCGHCGKEVRNPELDFGCAKWCRYAKECLGAAFVAASEASVCDRLVGEMKRVFGDDERRIRHALAVLKYAEQILEAEGGDPLVVKATAILHDIGIQEAERKYGSSAGRFQEIEGPPIARPILEALSVSPDQTDHICRIVGSHHSANDLDTLEFRIVWDADQLVNLLTRGEEEATEERCASVAGRMRTETGRKLAAQPKLEQRVPKA
jgi:HD superfamily phosphodiesterase/DNA-directed RNA polymerase subunit RPC12/RpoP